MMKRIINIKLIILFLGLLFININAQETDKNVFHTQEQGLQSDNVFSTKKNNLGSDALPNEGGGGDGFGEPLPIDNFVPVLFLSGIIIITFITYKQQRQRNKI